MKIAHRCWVQAPASIGLGRKSRRAGFSFTEVLFAVMILGIGFIMIAAVFPVAISQTAASQEETVGAAAARSAASAFSDVPYLGDVNAIVPGTVTRLLDDKILLADGVTEARLWPLVKGNQILPDDPRFGWVAMIKRDTTNFNGQTPSIGQLIVVPVQVRGGATFTDADRTQTLESGVPVASLMPIPVTVDLKDKSSSNEPDECTVTGTGNTADAAAPGAVVVLKNGKIYRLGELKTGNTYYLLPGNDLTSSSEDLTGANAFIVGRQRVGTAFTGPSMAIGVYVTYLQLQ